MSSPSEHGSGHRPPVLGRVLKWSLGSIAAVVVLAAILVGLFRIAANLVPRYHARIEQEVSTQLGAPVDIRRISLAWHGLGPALRFYGVRILDAEGKHALISVSRIRLDFHLLALLHGTYARPSGVALTGLQLTLAETPQGRLHVPGLPLSSPAGGHAGLAAMLDVQASVSDATIRFIPAGLLHESWIFHAVNLQLGGGRRHEMRMRLDMPSALGGGTLRAGGTLETSSADPSSWQWNLHCSVDRLQIGPLLQVAPNNLPRLMGTVTFDGAGAGRGASDATVRGHILATNLVAGKSRIARFDTSFTLEAKSGYTLTLHQPQILQASSVWSPGTVRLGRDANGRLQAQIATLHLARLPPLTGFFPKEFASLASRINAMAPVGEIDDFDARWTPGEAGLGLDATIKDVSVLPADHVLGFRHFSAAVKIANGTGTVDVDAPDFTLLMPHIFDHPVELDRVAGNIGIALSQMGLTLKSQRLAISGPAKLDGALEGEINVPSKGPVSMQLSARAGPMSVIPARQDYLPTRLLPKGLDHWLQMNLTEGKVTGASLVVDGQIDKFPFANGGGRFAIDLGFNGVALRPGNAWLPMGNLAGTVHFRNAGLLAEVTSGTAFNAHVTRATAQIADLSKPRLQVKAAIAGNASDVLSFLRSSPIAGRIESAIAGLRANGPATAEVALELPVLKPANFSLSGKLRLSGATASYGNSSYMPSLTHLTGSLSFDDRGPTLGSLKGRLLETPVNLTLRREGDPPSIRLELNGVFPVATLSGVMHHDLAKYLTGTLPLRADLTVPLSRSDSRITIAVYSTLDGLAVLLPVPMKKASGVTVPFSARGIVRDGAVHVSANYGDVLAACARFALQGGRLRFGPTRLVLGDQACAPPESGFFVSGGWKLLDIKPWLAEFPSGNTHPASPPVAVAVDLRFGKVKAFGFELADQSIEGAVSKRGMNFAFTGPDLAGKLAAPPRPTNSDPFVVDLTRAHLALPGRPVAVAPTSAARPASTPVPTSSSRATPALTSSKAAPVAKQVASRYTAARAARSEGLHPGAIPPFRLHAAYIDIGKAQLTDVLVTARHVPGGLLVDPIHVGGGALSLDGKFVWIEPKGGEPQGALHFVAHAKALGALLSGLDLGPIITGHGSLSTGLAWHSFRSEHFADELLGRISVDLRDGSISQVSPGAGRLLSLLAVVNIPRYLVLDFHNLASKGFPYSRIHGDYVIDRGIAKTSGLLINSSIADIKLTGLIDLRNETIDQKAAIVPNYTGSLPIVGALFGGLGVGAAVFALTKILGSPISHMSEREYSITGPLNKVVVKPAGQAPPPKSGAKSSPSRASAGSGM